MIASKTSSREIAGSFRPGPWLVPALFCGWTVLGGLAVWWLIQQAAGDRPSIMRMGPGEAKSWGVRLREFIALARLNAPWAFGWILLAPYVLWIGARFSFEKARWWARLPVLLDENDRRMPLAELLPSDPIDPQNPLPRSCDVLARALGQKGGTNAGLSVFKCPEDKLGWFAREGSSYEWNTDLNGRRMDETRSTGVRIIKVVVIDGQPVEQSDERKTLRFPPSTTPLLLDYEDCHPRPPRPGKNVVYMDGHVTGFELPPEAGVP